MKNTTTRRFSDKDKNIQAAIDGLLASHNGRLLLMGLLEACHVFSMTFDTDSRVDAFRQGERNVGLRLIAMINAEGTTKFANLMLAAQRDFAEYKPEQDERNEFERSLDIDPTEIA